MPELPDQRLQADAFKNEANALLKSGHYEQAVEKYTQAIQLCDTVPAYFTNRALAQTRLENFGYAIEDASRALDIDPNFVKANYRKGLALMALGRFRDARKELKIVVKRASKDEDAKRNLDACEKMIRRQDFEKAIQVNSL